MADYQRIIDEMHNALASSGDYPQDSIAAINEQYIDAIRTVNERLRVCRDLLVRGQRSEVIRQCNAEPKLLEAVAILDIPERVFWNEVTSKSGLPSADEILIDTASDVNDAFLAEQPLEGLLRSHRLLALGHAPLPQRISVLRRIRMSEPSNPVWEEDLCEYEKVRISQLPGEILSARQQRNLGALARLERELRSDGWVAPPSKDLIDQAVAAHTGARQEAARHELERLVDPLGQAFASLDLPHGRTLRMRWNAAAAIALHGDGDELAEAVAPALEWLEEEDHREQADHEFVAALAQLEESLDDGVSYEELERLQHAVRRFNREIPPLLEARVAERFRFLGEQRTRRNRLLVLMGVLVVLLTGVGVGFGVHRHLRNMRVVQSVDALQAFLGEEKLDAAQSYMDQLKATDPSVVNDPRIEGCVSRLLEAQRVKREREDRFLTHINVATPQSHGPADWKWLTRARQELEVAKGLARSDPEVQQVAQLEIALDTIYATLQKETDSQFHSRFEELKKEMARVGELDDERLGRLHREATTLRYWEHVSSDLTASVDPIITRLASQLKEREELQQKRDMLERLALSVGQVVRFRELLEEYSKAFPTESRSADFGKVAKTETLLWEDVEAWNKLVRSSPARDIAEVTPEGANALCKAISDFQIAHNRFPEPTGLQRVMDCLQAVGQRRDSTGERIYRPLNEMLNSPTLARLSMLRLRDGKSYYFLRNEPFEHQETVSVQYVTGFGLDTQVRVEAKKLEIANARSEEGYDWMSPQTKFSKDALDRLARLNDASWEATFCAIIARLSADHEMDPIVRLQLMHRFLEVACQGSQCIRDVYRTYLDAVANAGIDQSVNWLDPEDKDAAKAREQALRILGTLTDCDSLNDRVMTGLAEIRSQGLGPQYRWVGVLRKDREGGWSCIVRSVEQKGQSGELCVLDVPAGTSRAAFRNVGTLRGEQVSLAGNGVAYVEGRAVFLVTEIAMGQ